jgi:hypothetical protein
MAKFEEVLQEERKHLWGQDHTVVEPEGAGLAFSGGGIRSATFNLGILQGLAQAKLLDKIDYLSTVSGGGYIGSWLASWIYRQKGGVTEVQRQLGGFPEFRPANETDVEPKQVNFLRDYSNYMTPRLGIFGADTWAAVATYLRNVILNQLILIALLGAVILLPWCVLATSHAVAGTCWFRTHRAGIAIWIAVFAGLLLAWTVCWASAQATRSSFTKIEAPPSASQTWVLILVILPLFCSAVLTMMALWVAAGGNIAHWSAGWWALVGAGSYGVTHVFGVLCRYWTIVRLRKLYGCKQPSKTKQRGGGDPSHDAETTPAADSCQKLGLTLYQWLLIPAFALCAGAIGGLLLDLLVQILGYWKFCGGGFAHALAWGPLLFVVAFLFIGALHIGLLKILIQNEEQEWWGRAGGLVMLISIAWTGLFALTIFVPWLFATQGEWIKTKTAVALAWVATTAFGVISGKSSKTSGQGDGNRGLEIGAVVSPYIFIIGLMVLLSSGAFWIAKYKSETKTTCTTCAAEQVPAAEKGIAISLRVAHSTADGAVLALTGNAAMEPAGTSMESSASLVEREEQFWKTASALDVSRLWIFLAGLLAAAVLVSCRVDINIFSMNLLYRNRLVRCYLGASRRDCTGESAGCEGRRPNPFTGFDPDDDLPLALFRRNRPVSDAAAESASARNVWDVAEKSPYTGPYPILCAALNVTHGERLAWQERKAESFVFTPLFCGYDFEEMHRRTDKEMRAARSRKNSSAGAPEAETPDPELVKPDGYQRTEEYAYPKDSNDPSHEMIGGVRVGTAISISGAAASPNMGYHTSPPLAFLMTMFDVRLGWWLANPRYTNEEISWLKPKGAPRCSLTYLLAELFASTTDMSKFVYLSDGGHFENLAIYELVRRRCKYIIAGDGDADEKVVFGDLGNTIRKCRSDFGVEITLDTAYLQPDPKGFAKAHGVVGTISYPPPPGGTQPETGHIIYIKPTITRDVSRDVLAYRDTNAPFPNQTTADQWFDESQFESYRKLGLQSLRCLAGIKNERAVDKPISMDEFLTEARKYNPPARPDTYPPGSDLATS